jgi:2-oxo-4-hydroxy-4-carboxy-5-ureidoimidazoline decarboxylase
MAGGAMTLDAINRLPVAEFVAQFGEIAEHAPWVAELAASQRPFADADAMVDAFQMAVLGADPARQQALLCAHPDLAGKAALAGALTADSAREQAGAGLGALTPAEYADFHAMNDRYRARFGIPFILAVKGATKQQILESFASRVNGTRREEQLTALAQVLRIIRFRLEARTGEII